MIVILCQGRATRLRGVVSGPKHLVPFQGEPILGRTLRLLAECPMPIRDVTVVGPPELAAVAAMHGAALHTLERAGECVLQGLAASAPVWQSEPTITVLLGDVIWSRRALFPFMQVAFSRTKTTFAVSTDLSTTEGEIFGFHADQHAFDEIIRCCVKCNHNTGSEQCGHMRRLLHTTLAGGIAEYDRWPIIDWTSDIDEPIDITHLPRLDDCDAWDELVWNARQLIGEALALDRRRLATGSPLDRVRHALARIDDADQPRCKCGRKAIMVCTACHKPRGSCNCARVGGGEP